MADREGKEDAGLRQSGVSSRRRGGEDVITSQIGLAKSLLAEEARIRSDAWSNTEGAVKSLLKSLQVKDRDYQALEKALETASLEKRMLEDLLKEQAQRCVMAEQKTQQTESQLMEVKTLLTTTLHQAKSQAQKLKDLRKKEQEAVSEVNRRAVEQATLRDHLKKLELQAKSNGLSSTKAVELQDKVLELRKTLRDQVANHEKERLSSIQQRLDLEKQVSRLKGELDAEKDTKRGRTESISSVMSSSLPQLHALQDRCDGQVMEIIRLKNDATRREKEVLDHKEHLDAQAQQIAQLEKETFGLKAELLQAKAAIEQANTDPTTRANLELAKESKEDPELLQHLEAARTELSLAREALQTEKSESRQRETALQQEIVSLNEVIQVNQEDQLRYSQIDIELASTKAKLDVAIANRDEAEALLGTVRKKMEEEVAKREEEYNEIRAVFDGAKKDHTLDTEPATHAENVTLCENLVKEMKKLQENIRNLEVNLEVKECELASMHESHSEYSPVAHSTVLHTSSPEIEPKEQEKPSTSALTEEDRDELLGELAELKRACIGQQTIASHLKRQLGELRNVQEVSTARVAKIADLEKKLDIAVGKEKEVNEEAKNIREEATKISGATRKLMLQMRSLSKLSASSGSFRKSPKAGSGEKSDFNKNDDNESNHDKPEEQLDEEEYAPERPIRHQRNNSTSSVLDEIEKNHATPLRKTLAPGSAQQASPKPNEWKEQGQQRMLMTGYLTKAPAPRVSQYWSKWRRRFFVLTPTSLVYFKTGTSPLPRGIMDLRKAKIVGPRDVVDEKAHKFFVCTQQRVFALCAETSSEMKDWVKALKKVAANQVPGAASAPTALPPSDYYAVLGLGRDATTSEIIAAFETQAQEFHPSVNADPDPVKFARLKRSFNVLSSPGLRADYDTSLDIKEMFQATVYAYLLPRQQAGKVKGVRAGRKPQGVDFFMRPGFAGLLWADPGSAGARGNVAWKDVEEIMNGEDSAEGALYALPIERAKLCFSIVLKDTGTINVEVDRKSDRDKIVHGLRMILEDYRAAEEESANMDLALDDLERDFAEKVILPSPPALVSSQSTTENRSGML